MSNNQASIESGSGTTRFRQIGGTAKQGLNLFSPAKAAIEAVEGWELHDAC